MSCLLRAGISQSYISQWLLQQGLEMSDSKRRAFYRWYLLERNNPGEVKLEAFGREYSGGVSDPVEDSTIIKQWVGLKIDHYAKTRLNIVSMKTDYRYS